jgi:SAM-dependent methyltransferase
MEVCLVNRNTVSRDQRVLQEATTLTQAGLKVVIIGTLGAGDSLSEIRSGFCIRRIRPPSLRIAAIFRSYCYLPIRHRLPNPLRKWARVSYSILSLLLAWVDTRLRIIIIYGRLFNAMLNVRADYYHTHAPFALLVATVLAARIRGATYVADFNDILVMSDHGSFRVYYEQENAWGKELRDSEEKRIQATIPLIPQDVDSILDLGCGDGRITNQLANIYPQVIGLDMSRAALRYVDTYKVFASVTSLPFKCNAVDLVLTTELLEHLPAPDYLAAIKEIKRLASKWILLGVPLNEQLAIAYARCPSCRITFHINYHFRRFDENDMHKLFTPEYKVAETEQCGGQARTYVPFLLWIRHHIGGVWARTENTVCPRCNRHLLPSNLQERNVVTKFCDGKNKRANKAGTRKSHLVVLYRRTSLL